jgi:hypothetical protein
MSEGLREARERPHGGFPVGIPRGAGICRSRRDAVHRRQIAFAKCGDRATAGNYASSVRKSIQALESVAEYLNPVTI